MEKEKYIEEIALMVVEKLIEMNKEHNLDLVDLFKNNVSVQIIPAGKLVASADEAVPEEEEDQQDIYKMQKEIMDRVLVELQKKEHTNLMN